MHTRRHTSTLVVLSIRWLIHCTGEFSGLSNSNNSQYALRGGAEAGLNSCEPPARLDRCYQKKKEEKKNNRVRNCGQMWASEPRILRYLARR
ncbi:hypothetical protein F5Y01DRAFT_271543 [Xylaria sp. FL0043]|nr:hypothetical protein F5Y01DRAFT_271543 [Xylaria sp. FL0043]